MHLPGEFQGAGGRISRGGTILVARAVASLHCSRKIWLTNNCRRNFMKHSRVKANFFAVALVALLLVLSVPATSLAKDRNHGRDNRDNRSWSRHNRKCGKFVNCHDARNGKWDRRGARGDRVGNVVWRNRSRNRVNVNNNWLNRSQRLRRYRIDN